MGLRLERAPRVDLFGGGETVVESLVLPEIVHKGFVEVGVVEGQVGDAAEDLESQRPVEGVEVLGHVQVEGGVVSVVPLGSLAEVGFVGLALGSPPDIVHVLRACGPLTDLLAGRFCCCSCWERSQCRALNRYRSYDWR